MKKKILYSIAFFIFDCAFVALSFVFSVVEVGGTYFWLKYLLPYTIAEKYLHHIVPFHHGAGILPELTIVGYIFIFIGVGIGLYINFFIINVIFKDRK